jgi:hypothetical protein
MGSRNVPPIRAENSGAIVGIIEEHGIVFRQERAGPIAHVPYPDSVVIRGGEEQSAIRREIKGADVEFPSFERIPYEFCVYFPDLAL